jgi:hypothetical protein
LLIEESYHRTRPEPVTKTAQGRSINEKTCDEGNEMPTRIKCSFKTWMLVYVALVVALISASISGETSAASVSPGTYPSGTTANKVFFAPTIERPRRNDI